MFMYNPVLSTDSQPCSYVDCSGCKFAQGDKKLQINEHIYFVVVPYIYIWYNYNILNNHISLLQISSRMNVQPNRNWIYDISLPNFDFYIKVLRFF